MSTVYHTSPAPAAAMLPVPCDFEKRWKRVEPLSRFHFAARTDEEYVNRLIAEAHAHLQQQYMVAPEVMRVSSDAQWVEIALKQLLRKDETHQSSFGHQFEIIERRLHHWAHQHFKAELIEDIVQSAYIKLWNDYQRHQEEWDTKPESFWVSSGKLAMRSAARDLRYQTQHRTGSSRRHDTCEWVSYALCEHELRTGIDEDDEQNDLLDLLSQTEDHDIHGKEVQRANLRLDLEIVLNVAKMHFRPAVFERCLLVLERLMEGYTPAEIRLELGWTPTTYDGTMTFVRRISQFAEGYQRAPNRCTKMSEVELARIQSLRAAGLTQPEIARLVGRNLKTIWKATQPASIA